MDPTTIVQWITTTGGISAFAIWMLVKAYADKEALYAQNKADAERYALAYHEIILLMLAALEKGTEGSTTVVAKIDALTTALEIASQRQESWFAERRLAHVTAAAGAATPAATTTQ